MGGAPCAAIVDYFRERPLVNTNWQLVFNQRTEMVNEDINLGGLDDIEVHIFYTDFTVD